MEWILINNERSILQEFHLLENDGSKVIMKYNPLHCSVRISYADRYGLFFIENAGSLSGKYVFKNEYGMEVGTMIQEKWFEKDGSVMIEDSKYAYTVNDYKPVEFIIYEGISQRKITTCGLSAANGAASFTSSPADTFKKCLLLLGLCWYLSLAVTRESRVEHAA